MRNYLRNFALLTALLVVVLLLLPSGSKVDFGEWRAIVVHSDDWGLEGWFPAAISDSLRSTLSRDVPGWQEAYLHSTLETGREVDELAAWFATLRDLDDLPFVLQANTIMAGPSVREETDAAMWGFHVSGTGPDYFRPELVEAVDAAISSGVWRPELHGLTHYDLVRYARARHDGDPLALAAAAEGVFAYEGYRTEAELDRADAAYAREVIGDATALFEERFGRRPVSVIAADYRWGNEDEVAWEEAGIEVVQAKREQVDRSIAPHTRWGRLQKWLRRFWFDRASGLTRIERTVDLEPYGDAGADAAQGAAAAHRALEEALGKGEVAVLSIHRVQLVSTDPDIAAAGRTQLAEVLRLLDESGGVRFLVDAEVVQLREKGWSVLQRGALLILRNWTDEALDIVTPDGSSHRVAARSSVVLSNL